MADNKRKHSNDITVREQTYEKSNELINSKGKSSALGLKLFAIAISSVQQSSNGELKAVLTGKELREIFGNRNGSFYTEIKEIIQPTDEHTASILDWRLYLNDPEKEKIIGLNVISTAKFEGGILELTINSRLKKELLSLKGNYTRLSLPQVIALKSPFSIKCYEVFKAYMDKQEALGNPGPEYELTYNYREFRQLMGLTPIAKKNGDREAEPLSAYSSFRRQVLDKSKAEISEKTSIKVVDYVPIKIAHGKVAAIRFIIRRQNSPFADEEENIVDAVQDLTESQKNSIMGQTVVLLMSSGIDASAKDVAAICRAGQYQMNKISEAVNMCAGKKNIEHPTAWIISALRNNNYGGIKETPAGGKGSSGSPNRSGTGRSSGKSSFSDFEQHDYDFNELERQLLSHD